MKQARRLMGSVDEPNAFRISRPPPSTDPSFRPEPSTPPLLGNQEYVSEPASWLHIGDLTSPLFNPYDFLQKALSDRFDRSARPSHLPLLGDTFDADAALAALDTVESALRRTRDASRAEEATARDEVRNALHLAAKKKQSLIATAETVTAQVSSIGQVGNTAASALAEDILSLESLSAHLLELQDARDMLSLLALDSSALNAVRVSRLLARARSLIDSGSLNNLLGQKEVRVAREELRKCAEDLAKSVFEWMRTAVDSGNSQVIRDCATAASHLDIDRGFVREYVDSALKFDSADHDQQPSNDPEAILESFRRAMWEVVSAVKEVIPTISESFAAPSQPLAFLLHRLIEEHISPIATGKVNLLSSMDYQVEKGSQEFSISTRKRDDPSAVGLRAFMCTPGERLEGTPVPSSQSRNSDIPCNATSQECFINAFAEVLRAVMKVNVELFDICRVPGTTDVENAFAKLPDPYCKFLLPLITKYVEIERAWIDDQLGVAFSEVTRIDSNASRLAPRKRSDPEVYHRYRAFYSHIVSSFVDMTKQAVSCAEKSLSRASDIFRSVRAIVENPRLAADEIFKAKHVPPSAHSQTNTQGTHLSPAKVRVKTWPSLPASGNANSIISWSDSRISPHAIIEEVLGCVVMNYLANAETILQAATHLLPACNDDAQMQELWMSGASPLAAYSHAIDVLAESNAIIDDFLRHISETEALDEAFGNLLCREREKGETQVLSETLDRLQNDLNSGLTDLGTEAQIGVRAAVAFLKIRLGATLGSQVAKSNYTSPLHASRPNHASQVIDARSESDYHLEPTPTFVSAAMFLEQQLQSVVTTVKGGNRDFILSELAAATREAVLDCWCSCDGPVSSSGALQLVSDAKSITRAFRNRTPCMDELECLAGVGQLFTESAESLWRCVEAKSLTNLQGTRIACLLSKRYDIDDPSIQKICQSLGATRHEHTPGKPRVTPTLHGRERVP